LDSKKIVYRSVETPAEKLGAVETANYLKVPPSMIYKTIVLLREKKGKSILVVIPGDLRVDLKSVAAILGEKKVTTATEKEAESLTALKVGGISALSLLNRGFKILLDESSANLEEFYVSGGMRGLMIRMRVEDFQSITAARMAPIAFG